MNMNKNYIYVLFLWFMVYGLWFMVRCIVC